VDYLARIKIQNGRIYKLMRNAGIANAAELARLANVDATTLSEILNFKKPPMTSKAQWRDPVKRIANVLCCSPEDMFSEEQVLLKIPTNTAERFYSRDDIMRLYASAETKRLEDIQNPVETFVSQDELKTLVKAGLDGLTNRERKVVTMLFGLNGEKEIGPKEVATIMDCSLGLIDQIRQKAFRKLRNPCFMLSVLEAE